MTRVALSVVIAVQYAQQNLSHILRQIDLERHQGVDIIVCYTDADAEVPELVRRYSNVRPVESAFGSLIPEMWRDGILSAAGSNVALTTAHCIPDEHWLENLLNQDLREVVAVGGAIDGMHDALPRDWAIFILRYLAFTKSDAALQVKEIAADNAVYRKEDILDHMDLLKNGFWEPSFHARFHACGLALRFDPALRVIHANQYTAVEFFQQRLAHGTRFGLARASQLTVFKRSALILASPILPFVFLGKIVASLHAKPKYRQRLHRALPWLLLFLLGWGLGEMWGYIKSIKGRKLNWSPFL